MSDKFLSPEDIDILVKEDSCQLSASKGGT
jgi:hypothetical protein